MQDVNVKKNDGQKLEELLLNYYTFVVKDVLSYNPIEVIFQVWVGITSLIFDIQLSFVYW